MSREEIENMRDQGWIFVSDGADWGLEQTAYLARNSDYNCNGNEPTPTPTVTPTPYEFQYGGAPICIAEKPESTVLLSVVRNGSSATITWSEVANVTHYTIAYGTDKDNLEYGVPSTGNVTSFTINELDPAKTYYFIVYSVNDCMPSEPSTQGSQVLGLAATGNISLIYSLMAFGTTSSLLGLQVKKKRPY